MNKKDIKEFFDSRASLWDDEMILKEDIIKIILDNAGIKENIDVLDVACGTGVLFDYYLERNVHVVGIDLSEEMVKIAKSKYPDVSIICGDVETINFNRCFDVVMVYNAFPHFPSPKSLISVLASLVKKGGKISIAHSMSKANLALHHRKAKHVSIDLIDENELALLLSEYFTVDHVISNEDMYQVTGIRL